MQAARTPRWTRRPEERPQELLDAALEVFSTNGYRATRLEQVAEAAGVTKGSIYYYFSTKEELLTQALESRIGTIFSGIEAESHRPAATAVDRLRTVLRAAWTRWRMPETARMHRLIMGELRTELPDLFDAAMRAGPMHVWRLVGEVLRDGQRNGEFGTHFDAGSAARFLVSGLMHQALLQTDLHERGLDATPPERISDAGLDVLLHGILPQPEGTLEPKGTPGEAAPVTRRRRSPKRP
ncbi:MAG TPA: TetR/AcrR family transcriptional regulator [Gemmatimonadales bacterium]